MKHTLKTFTLTFIFFFGLILHSSASGTDVFVCSVHNPTLDMHKKATITVICKENKVCSSSMQYKRGGGLYQKRTYDLVRKTETNAILIGTDIESNGKKILVAMSAQFGSPDGDFHNRIIPRSIGTLRLNCVDALSP